MKKLPVLSLFAAVLGGLALILSACQCEDDFQTSVQCQCPLLTFMETDSMNCPIWKNQPPPVCGVCTIYCDNYAPCAPSVLECPAQNCKKLAACPLCPACKKMLLHKAKQSLNCTGCRQTHGACPPCVRGRMNMPVKMLMNDAAVKANRNCKKCPKIAKADAKVCALKHAKECKTACKKTSSCVCPDNCDCNDCGTPDCTCACPCAPVVLTEEEVLEILPDPTPAGPVVTPPLPMPADVKEPAQYPIPAPPATPSTPDNIVLPTPAQLNQPDVK